MKISKGLHIGKCHYIGNQGPLYRTCDIPASILWINIYTKALYFPIQWLAPYTVDNNIQKLNFSDEVPGQVINTYETQWVELPFVISSGFEHNRHVQNVKV